MLSLPSFLSDRHPAWLGGDSPWVTAYHCPNQLSLWLRTEVQAELVVSILGPKAKYTPTGCFLFLPCLAFCPVLPTSSCHLFIGGGGGAENGGLCHSPHVGVRGQAVSLLIMRTLYSRNETHVLRLGKQASLPTEPSHPPLAILAEPDVTKPFV